MLITHVVPGIIGAAEHALMVATEMREEVLNQNCKTIASKIIVSKIYVLLCV